MRSSPKYAKTLSVTLIACAAIFFFITTGHTADSPLIISEFRLRGPNGANDEFIEIYNNSNNAVNVQASDGSSGYAVAGLALFKTSNSVNFNLANRLDAVGSTSVANAEASPCAAPRSNNHQRKRTEADSTAACRRVR